MNKRKLLAIFLVSALVTALLGLMTGSAQAACTNSGVRFAGNWNYDDEETATYARVFDEVKKNCDGTYTRRVGLYPNRDKNRRLSCSGVRDFVFNPSSVYGRNPATFRVDCDSDGFSKAYRWRPSGTDRTFNMSGYADKVWMVDFHFKTPARTAQRR